MVIVRYSVNFVGTCEIDVGKVFDTVEEAQAFCDKCKEYSIPGKVQIIARILGQQD